MYLHATWTVREIVGGISVALILKLPARRYLLGTLPRQNPQARITASSRAEAVRGYLMPCCFASEPRKWTTKIVSGYCEPRTFPPLLILLIFFLVSFVPIR